MISLLTAYILWITEAPWGWWVAYGFLWFIVAGMTIASAFFEARND